ncbi:PD-(D/E)XK nuclease family protein [Brachybacterium paraconglomeratum]|uniref:PD-(D/E)XK nuclease family protein n=1 Tax=Brachybacterium paraconglomeratum TaxID=173362 RepID=UPI0022AF906D|nr:PD-(D/E)XK nuclease family protein [Brachybacterium paraconglomeratum]MCZ4328018.1 PD-(D/E)XK nuclease family protein [Brachybacterium paraconglomeratum]
MAERPAIDPALVTALVPTLSRSLAEQFNVFRVMHHGTHEKQLSNVFAWLLNAQGTHHLGDAPQRIFLELVNGSLPADSRLPTTGYDVAQEVVTPGSEGEPVPELADIADIVLSSPEAAIVVENFGTSDGHGHDFRRYLALGTANDRSAAVVLLCQRHEPHLQRDGWQRAVVITYAELLRTLRAHIAGHRAWIRQNPEQHFFIRQLFEHFVEGPAAMNTEDTLAFLTAMCETGESARYGQRPRDRVAEDFADLMAAQARRQFEDSLALLAATKKALRGHANATLVGQVNAQIPAGPIEKVVTRFVGQWEWCVELQRSDDHPTVFFEFGPTAVAEQERVPRRLEAPDYSQVFVSLQGPSGEGISRLAHTGVGLTEVLDGLQATDLRLRDAVLGIVAQ